jgi:hypothetical protein
MVVQNSYTSTLATGTEGQFAFERDKASVLSKEASDSRGLPFGRGVALADTAGGKVRNMQSDQAKYVMDADFTTGNFTGNLVVNGVTNAFSIAFNASHLQSQQDAETAFELIAGILSATIDATDVTNRTLILQADPETDISFNTLASSGVVFTVTNTDSKDAYGISTHQENEPDSSGVAQYKDGEEVGVARQAYIHMKTDATLNPGDTAFLRFHEESGDDKKRGMLTATAGSSPTKAKIWAEAWIEKGATAGNLAIVGINLP